MAQENNTFGLGPLDQVIAEWEQGGGGMGKAAAPARKTETPDIMPDTRMPTAGPSSGNDLLPPPSFVPLFESAARKYQVPVNVLMALAQQESSYNPTVRGQPTQWGQAKGMMQYLDGTARMMGINPYDPVQSVDAAAKQLKERLDKGYSMEDAVREHFAGPDRKLWGPKTARYGVEVLNKARAIGSQMYPVQPVAPQEPEEPAAMPAAPQSAAATNQPKKDESFFESVKRNGGYLIDDVKMGWNNLLNSFEGQRASEYGDLLDTFKKKYTPEQIAADPKLQAELKLREEGFARSVGDIAARNKENQALLQQGRPETQQFFSAGGKPTREQLAIIGDALAKNPVGIIADLGVQSGPQSLAMITAAVMARFGGGSTTTAAVAGGGASAYLQFGSDYAELREQGLSHDEAWKKAAIKAPIVGAFDAVSLKSAGSALDNILKKTGETGFKATAKEVAKKAGEVVKETGKQAGLGMGGEAAGSLASGRTPEAVDVIAEGLGEIAGAPAEAISMRSGRNAAAQPAPTQAPATPSGPIGRAVQAGNDAAQARRVVVNTPTGTFSGFMEDYQDDGQGGYVARILGDDGQTHRFSSSDNVSIRAESNVPALPAPTITVDSGGRAMTTEQRQASMERRQQQAATEAERRKQLGITPDVERAAAAHNERTNLPDAVANGATVSVTTRDGEVIEGTVENYQRTDSSANLEVKDADGQTWHFKDGDFSDVAVQSEAEPAAAVEPEPAAKQEPKKPAPKMAEPAPVQPEQEVEANPAARPLNEWEDDELLDRLNYLSRQAKLNGGWNKLLTDEKNKVSAEQERRAAGQPAPAAPVTAAPISTTTEAAPAATTKEKGNARASDVPQPATAGEARPDQPVAAPPTQESPVAKDEYAGKWFGSQEKADAFLAKKNAAGTHQVVQTGKVRFEIKPLAAEADAAPETSKASPEDAKFAEIDRGFAANREAMKGFKTGDEVSYVARGTYKQPDGTKVVDPVRTGKITKVSDKDQGIFEIDGNLYIGARHLTKATKAPTATAPAVAAVTTPQGKPLLEFQTPDGERVMVRKDQYEEGQQTLPAFDQTGKRMTGKRQQVARADLRSIDEKPAAEAPARAKKPAKKKSIKKSETHVGKNAEGRDIYEDENGVRSVRDGGISRSEPVLLEPTRQGVRVSTLGRPDEFKTADELSAAQSGDEIAPETAAASQSETAAAPEVAPAQAPAITYESGNMASGRAAFREGKPRELPSYFTNKTGKTAKDWLKGWDAEKADQLRDATKMVGQTEKPAVSENKVFTEDAAEKARAVLRAKLNQLNTGIDPEIMQAGITLAGYYIEKGARTFSAYAKVMVGDMGEVVKPYLKSWYAAMALDPRASGFDGMTPLNEVQSADLETILSAPADIAEQSETPILEVKGDGNDTEAATADTGSGAGRPSAQGERADEGRGTTGDLFGQTDGADAPVDARRAGRNRKQRVEGDAAVQQSGNAGADAELRLQGRRGDSAGAGDRADRQPATAARNYRIAAGELKREGSWKATAARNIDIVELVKRLESEGRIATAEEKALLTKFTGWGASEIANGVFPNQYGQYKEGWRELGERLKSVLTPEEYEQAKRTTQYAHYTSEGIIRSAYDALGRMGFKGGSFIEPGMGIGLFNGLMPASMAANSSYTGIEYDGITGAIAKHLYPESNVIIGDYTKTALPKDFFDAAIGNPPFGSISITNDPEYKKHGFMLHDYFFAKTIDRVKPGGMVVFVTSKGTMDKASSKARQYLADRANLVGAVRLPQTAFKDNAGTEVVTDVLFLQKRGPGVEDNGVKWLGLKDVTTAKGEATPINEYFADHPEMVLGEHAMTGSMYRANEYTVLPREGDIEQHFAEALKNLPESIYRPERGTQAERAVVMDRDFNPTNRKEGGLYVAEDGRLMQVEDGSGVVVETRTGSDGKQIALKPKEKRWLTGWVEVRNALKQAQYDQLTDGDWEASLAALNKAYDAFVAEHGQVLAFTTIERQNPDGTISESKRYKNKPLFEMDAEGALAYALERENPDGTLSKNQVLLGRVLRRDAPPEIKTTNDAMFVSLNNLGRLDIDDVARLAGTTRDEAISALGTAIYEDPSSGWQQADAYLSGNVRRKLEEARAAAEINPRFKRNVEALLAVQPRPLGPTEITVRIGANWVPTSDYEAFAKDILGERMDVVYTKQTGDWEVTPYERNPASEWATTKLSAAAILDAVLNSRQIRVTYLDENKKSHVDEVETEKANDVARKMREAFVRWVWSDAERADRLSNYYNEHFNNIAPRQYDGSHLTLPGLSLRFNLYPHQKRAIWRNIQDGDTYLAHAVGAGKTFTMIASGMEMRRLGLIERPWYVVPNHMLAQFSREFLELYPTANVMVADEQNFHTGNRRRFLAQSALNDPDAVIITHSAFGRVGMSDEYTSDFIGRQIDEWKATLEDVDKSERVTRKQIERRIEQLERRLESKQGSEKKDKVMSFEETGADYLFVDEAHEFRKLDFPTNQGNIKGIDPAGSMRAMDLNMKVQYLRGKKPGRAVTLASGTPITNTMGEMFTVQRLMAPEQLHEDGLDSFDAWAAQYGDTVTALEQNAVGGYEAVTRFAKFQNVPELMRRIRSFMDILTNNNLGGLVKRPDVDGGQRQIIVTPSPEGYADYQKELEKRIKAIRARKGPPEKGQDIILNVIADGRFSAIDMRFVDPTAAPDPNSKLNVMLDDVIAKYRETANNEYVGPDGRPDPIKGSSLMIFSDIGLGEQSARTRGFSMRDWMMKRFTEAGIPPEHIAFIRDYKQHAKKERLFSDMREGKKRILIGGKDMETGVNVQKRLIHLYHLDAPWFPASVEQREGREVRQGNQNALVGISAYATKGSYDSTMWGMNARKARFIEQAMNGDDSVRSLDDVSEASSFEMASALASGDERYLKLAGLRGDVERLERLRQGHYDQQNKMRQDKGWAQSQIDRYGRMADELREAIKQRQPIQSGEFMAKVGTSSYDNREEFSKALFSAFKELAATHLDGKRKLGEIGGFPITFYGVGTGKDYRAAVHVDVPNSDSILSFPFDPDMAIGGIATRAANQVNGLDRRLSDVMAGIENEKKRIEQVSKRLGAPFPEEAELIEKLGQLNDLEGELAREGEAAAAAATPETVQAETAPEAGEDDEGVKFSLADPGVNFAAETLVDLSGEEDLFSLPVSKSATLKGAMADLVPNAEYYGEHTRVDERDETQADHRFVFTIKGRDQDKTFYVYTTDDGKVWIDVSRLAEDDGGQRIYAAVSDWAYNTRKQFVGDPVGLSEAAVIRRTSNMLASALRHGTTKHLEPAIEQEKGDKENGIEPLDWSGNDFDKVKALIHTFLSTINNRLPQISQYRYDFNSNQFVTRDGRPARAGWDVELEGTTGARRANAGRKTIRRAAFLQSLVEAEDSQHAGITRRVIHAGTQLVNGTGRLFSVAPEQRVTVAVEGNRLRPSSAGLAQLRQERPLEIRSTPEQRATDKAALRDQVFRDLSAQRDVLMGHPDIGAINLAKKGISKSLSNTSDRAKLLTIPHLAEVISEGAYLGSQPAEGKEGTAAYHYVGRRVLVDGVPLTALVTLEENNGGKVSYYNHTMTTDVPGAIPAKTGPVDAELASYRRPDFHPERGMSKPEARAARHGEIMRELSSGVLGPVFERLIESGRIVLHPAEATLPRSLRDKGAAVQGFTDAAGRMHLVTENLTPQTAPAVLLHEAFHGGGETLVGQARWQNLMGQLERYYKAAQQRRADGRNQAGDFWHEALRRVENAQAGGATGASAIEEFGAYAIEHYELAPTGIKKWVDNVIGMIKDWLARRFGLQLGALTPAQLRAFAAAALRNAVGTEPTDGRTIGGMAFNDGPMSVADKGKALDEAIDGLDTTKGTADRPDFVGNAIRDMEGWRSLYTRFLAHPYQVASLYPEFTPVFQTATSQQQMRNEIIEDLHRDHVFYQDLPQESKAQVNKVLELGRLTGNSWSAAEVKAGVRNQGYTYTVRLDEDNVPHRVRQNIDAQLTKAGDVVKLNDAEAQAYEHLRAMFDRALDKFRDQALDEFGMGQYAGRPEAAKAIMDTIAGLPDSAETRRLQNIAQFISDIEQAKRTGYVPFTRYGDYVVAVKERQANIQYELDADTGTYIAHNVPPALEEYLDTTGAQYDAAEQGWRLTREQRRDLEDQNEITVYSEKVETGLRDMLGKNSERNVKARQGSVSQIPSVKKAIDRVTAEKVGDNANRRIVAFATSKKRAEGGIDMSSLDALAEVAMLDPKTWEDVREQLAKAVQAGGFRKHFFQSSNVPGYSADFERSVADYVVGLSGYLARRAHNKEWDRTIADIKGDKLHRYATKYREYVNQPAEELALLRQTGFFLYLAGNISTAILNSTQVPLMTMPFLSMIASHPLAAAEVTRAYKDGLAMFRANNTTGYDLFDFDAAPADIKDDLIRARDEGLLLPLQSLEVMGVAGRRSVEGRRLQKGYDKTVQTLALPFTATERLNRIVTFIAANRLARKNGVQDRIRDTFRANPLAQATFGGKNFSPYAFAEFAVDETQFRMGKGNRPTAMRNVGTAILQFKSFMLQFLEAMYRNYNQHGTSGKLAAGATLGMLVALSGVWGAPGADDLRKLFEGMYKGITKKDFDVRTSLRQMIAETTGSKWLAALVDGGFPYTAGADMSRRIGMGQIMPDTRNPTGIAWLDSLISFGGVPADLMVGRPIRAAQQLGRGDAGGAATAFAPNFVENARKAANWSTDGVRTQTGRMVLPASEVKPSSVVMKAIGVQPTQVSEVYAYNEAQRRSQASADELKRQFTTDYVRALGALNRNTDPEKTPELQAEVQKVLQELADYNAKAAPDQRIVITRQSIKSQLQREMGGTASGHGKERKQARGAAANLREVFNQ